MLLISSSWTSSIMAEKKFKMADLLRFLARLLILIKKGGLLQLKFVGVNIYLWAR